MSIIDLFLLLPVVNILVSFVDIYHWIENLRLADRDFHSIGDSIFEFRWRHTNYDNFDFLFIASDFFAIVFEEQRLAVRYELRKAKQQQQEKQQITWTIPTFVSVNNTQGAI